MTTHTLLPAVLCGGVGSRLWPLSRRARPKQFHALAGPEPMLVDTLCRLGAPAGLNVLPPLVVGNAAHGDLLEEALHAAGIENGAILTEPDGRNSAPAVAVACLHALETAGPDALALVMASDHHVGRPDAFREAVQAAAEIAAEGRLVTFGIPATRPETGFGYIRRGAARARGFDVDRFIEKPPRADAEAMLAAGGHDWNSGIFLVHAATLVDELERQRPEMAHAVARAWAGRSQDGRRMTPDRAAWQTIEGDSIDYAVMEKTDRASVVPVDMDWSDVGSWAAIAEIAEADADGNAAPAGSVLVETTGSLVHSGTGRLVALVGCQDLVVVDTPDALLVMPKAKAQSVKAAVEALKSAGRDDLL